MNPANSKQQLCVEKYIDFDMKRNGEFMQQSSYSPPLDTPGSSIVHYEIGQAENGGSWSHHEHNTVKYHGQMIREQDRFLPIANVGRIMKENVPKHAKISKESKECVQECVSEFISFITSEAAELCKTNGRKAVNGDDIVAALEQLGFDNYVAPLRVYLEKYLQLVKGEKSPE